MRLGKRKVGGKKPLKGRDPERMKSKKGNTQKARLGTSEAGEKPKGKAQEKKPGKEKPYKGTEREAERLNKGWDSVGT